MVINADLKIDNYINSTINLGFNQFPTPVISFVLGLRKTRYVVHRSCQFSKISGLILKGGDGQIVTWFLIGNYVNTNLEGTFNFLNTAIKTAVVG